MNKEAIMRNFEYAMGEAVAHNGMRELTLSEMELIAAGWDWGDFAGSVLGGAAGGAAAGAVAGAFVGGVGAGPGAVAGGAGGAVGGAVTYTVVQLWDALTD